MDTQPLPTLLQTTATARRSDLASLTSIRAFAALWVFLSHLAPGQVSPLLKPFDYGGLGVSLFFVLSGFILTWSFRPGLTHRGFWWRRVARVYPSHLAMYAVVAVGVVLTGADATSAGGHLANVVLLQAWSPDPDVVFGVNGVSWTLSCEAFFYLAFPLVLAAGRHVRLRTFWVVTAGLFAAYAALAVTVSQLAQGTGLVNIVYTNPAIRFPQFLLGIAVARSVISGHRISGRLVYAAGACAVVGAVAAPQMPAPDAWITPVAAALIAWLAQRDIADATPRPLRWRWMQYAGRISFCFYLVHLTVIKGLGVRYERGPVVAILSLVLSVLAAAALHHVVEKPANRWLTRTGFRGAAYGRNRR